MMKIEAKNRPLTQPQHAWHSSIATIFKIIFPYFMEKIIYDSENVMELSQI